MLAITRYHSTDLEKVVELFRENVPDFFDSSEETHLRSYLVSFPENYFLLQDGTLIACGGFTIDRNKGVARISWDFVSSKLQRRGYGSMLLKHRIERISEVPDISTIEVLTSQFSFRYYQKHGFKVLFSVKDHWAEGYDLIAMGKDL